MKNRLLVVARYPDGENIKDGMAQRVYAADLHFAHLSRVYVNIHLVKNIRYKVMRKDGNLTVIECNPLLHFFLLLRLFRNASNIYFHSVYNVLPSLPLLWLRRKSGRLIWDVHGVVPEELRLLNLHLRALIYDACERYMARNADLVIGVTEKMILHLKQKYRLLNAKFLVYPILPSNIGRSEGRPETSSGKTTVLYSGNTQRWQNIDLMLETVRHNLSANVEFIILTGEPDQMKEMMEKHGLAGSQEITVLSVPPSQLHTYYEKAHYGFILREDIVVNQVACPTKLVEYLFYGMIPIVLSENIGDFPRLAFDFIRVSDFNCAVPPAKSTKNRQIAEKLIARAKSVKLAEYLCSGTSQL